MHVIGCFRKPSVGQETLAFTGAEMMKQNAANKRPRHLWRSLSRAQGDRLIITDEPAWAAAALSCASNDIGSEGDGSCEWRRRE